MDQQANRPTERIKGTLIRWTNEYSYRSYLCLDPGLGPPPVSLPLDLIGHVLVGHQHAEVLPVDWPPGLEVYDAHTWKKTIQFSYYSKPPYIKEYLWYIILDLCKV